MKNHRLARFGAIVLAYNVLVILWGAYVRATGSGAGCGNHWPLCNGEVIPRAPRVETMIEFTHRASSGIAFLAVLALLVLVLRRSPPGDPTRLGAWLSMLFMVTEALLGAGLVLFQLVADNVSTARALAMAVHLVNTFLLLGALTLTTYWAAGGSRVQLRGHRVLAGGLAIGLLLTMILGASGAITALGDTLFPVTSVAEGLSLDVSPTAHVLIRLRLLHPALAIATGIYLILLAGAARMRARGLGVQIVGRLVPTLVVIQILAGGLNVLLLAPVWMQLVHLLLADLIWISLVLLAALTLRPAEIPAAASEMLTSREALAS